MRPGAGGRDDWPPPAEQMDDNQPLVGAEAGGLLAENQQFADCETWCLLGWASGAAEGAVWNPAPALLLGLLTGVVGLVEVWLWLGVFGLGW